MAMSEGVPFPVVYTGDGRFDVATPYYAKRVSEQFEEGKKYTLVELQERSSASHAQFFASVHETWVNLLDEKAVQFPTADILRKHALIMTGFRRERRFIASSSAEARKIAAFLRPQSLSDDYAIISVHGNAVVEWKAKSQSYRAMPKGEFKKSKQAVLDWLADLIGVSAGTLQAEAGRAA